MRTTVTTTASPGHRPSPIAPEGIRSASPRAWWGDRGVKTKVLAAVAVVSLVAVLIGVMGISALGTSADSSRMLYASNIAVLTAAAEAQDQYRSQRTTAIVGLAVGIAAAVGVGFVVATGMARGVGRVQRLAEALANGDLTRSSGLTTRDELGRMGAALDGAVANLR